MKFLAVTVVLASSLAASLMMNDGLSSSRKAMYRLSVMEKRPSISISLPFQNPSLPIQLDTLTWPTLIPGEITLESESLNSRDDHFPDNSSTASTPNLGLEYHCVLPTIC